MLMERMYLTAFFIAINPSKIDVDDINQFWFCCYCACASLEHVLRSFCFQSHLNTYVPWSGEHRSPPRPIYISCTYILGVSSKKDLLDLEGGHTSKEK